MNLKTKYFICILFIGFLLSVVLRSPYLGKLSDGHHQVLTGSTAKFVQNWIEDGPINDQFLFIENPNSIEFGTLQSRGIYPSYPIGSALPIYALAKLLPSISIIKLIHFYSLANHLAISLVAFLIVYLSLKKDLPNYEVKKYALLAGISYIFMSKPFYWHSVVYFADQAAILPFAIILLLELKVRNNKNQSPLILIIQSILILFMLNIDYLAIPLSMIIFIFRLIDRVNIKGLKKPGRYILFNTLQIFLPIFIGVLIFYYQLNSNNLTNAIIEKFLYRAGLNKDGLFYIDKYGYISIINHIGLKTSVIMFATFVALTFGYIKTRKTKFLIPLIGFIVCTTQIILLRNHSIIHDFSVLKFFFPFSIGLFGIILSIRIKNMINNDFLAERVDKIKFILIVLLLIVSFIKTWRLEFPEPLVNFSSTGVEIRRIFSYADVLISLDENFHIPDNPPQLLTMSRKRVYKFESKSKALGFISNLPKNANLHFIVNKNNKCLLKPYKYTDIGSNNLVVIIGKYTNTENVINDCHINN